MQNPKETSRLKRHAKIRVKISGSADKPRLVVHRSLKNMHAQLIDDAENKTLFSLSTLDKELKGKAKYGGNTKAAESFGLEFARQAKEKGIASVVFDRAGYLYHGRIKAFAEALRKGGLVF